MTKKILTTQVLVTVKHYDTATPAFVASQVGHRAYTMDCIAVEVGKEPGHEAVSSKVVHVAEFRAASADGKTEQFVHIEPAKHAGPGVDPMIDHRQV